MLRRTKVVVSTIAISILGVSGLALASSKVQSSGAGNVQHNHELILGAKKYPCFSHVGKAKKVCVKNYKHQTERNSAKFPVNPTKEDVQKRVPDWEGFVRIGRCEQPGSSKYGDGVDWSNQGPTYGGGLGVFKSTWYMAHSPYSLWSGNKWETILVADSIRDQVGITAWGCHSAF